MVFLPLTQFEKPKIASFIMTSTYDYNKERKNVNFEKT